jgi:hypothetical protein
MKLTFITSISIALFCVSLAHANSTCLFPEEKVQVVPHSEVDHSQSIGISFLAFGLLILVGQAFPGTLPREAPAPAALAFIDAAPWDGG